MKNELKKNDMKKVIGGIIIPTYKVASVYIIVPDYIINPTYRPRKSRYSCLSNSHRERGTKATS